MTKDKVKKKFKVKVKNKSATPAKQQGTGFLDLPPELRNRIYRLSLIEKQSVVIQRETGSKSTRQRIADPPLLRTCHQIRSEAQPVFYGANQFYAFPKDIVRRWITAIGNERARMIRHLRISLNSRMSGHDSIDEARHAAKRKQKDLMQKGLVPHKDFVFMLAIHPKVVWVGATGFEEVTQREVCATTWATAGES